MVSSNWKRVREGGKKKEFAWELFPCQFLCLQELIIYPKNQIVGKRIGKLCILLKRWEAELNGKQERVERRRE